MHKPILFMGDTSLHTAAAYLAGCLSYSGWDFDYIPTGTSVNTTEIGENRKLFIISDYPAKLMSLEVQELLCEQVARGAGILMIGGWESFQGWRGTEGGWHGTFVADLLPVEISQHDDRVNCDAPVFVTPHTQHEIADDLFWTDQPPLIGGFNRVIAKPATTTVLLARQMIALCLGDQIVLKHDRTDPLLVIDETPPGRRAALMTDLAPHWIGPMVDWGTDRVTAHAPGAEMIEVGNLYVQFVQQLIRWVGRFE